MENEQILSPNESLALISDTIKKTKENLREHSFTYLLWGWMIAIASFSSFLLLLFSHSPFFFVPFPILSILAVVINIVYYFNQKITNPTETHLAYFLNRMWLVVFASISQKIDPYTYTIILGGIGTLTSGIVTKFRPLILGGILFFILAILSVYIPLEYKILVQGIAVIVGNLIPGYLLKHSKQ